MKNWQIIAIWIDSSYYWFCVLRTLFFERLTLFSVHLWLINKLNQFCHPKQIIYLTATANLCQILSLFECSKIKIIKTFKAKAKQNQLQWCDIQMANEFAKSNKSSSTQSLSIIKIKVVRFGVITAKFTQLSG